MREREVETYGVQQFRGKLRAEVRKVRWLDRVGAPDRLVMFDGNAWFVEFKSSKGKLRPEQKREIRRLLDAGMTVFVIDSKEEVDRIIHWYTKGRHLPGAPTARQVCNIYRKLDETETDKLVDELV